MLNLEDIEVCSIPITKGGFSLGITNGIKLIHKPTGTIAECDSERSQHRNRAIAITLLEEKLNERRNRKISN